VASLLIARAVARQKEMGLVPRDTELRKQLRDVSQRQEIDVQAGYPLSSIIQIAPGYAHIFPGTFLNKATPGKAYNLGYLMVTYQF